MSTRAFVKVWKLLKKCTEREKLAILFELEVEGYDRNGAGKLMEMEHGVCGDDKEVERDDKEEL